MKLSIGRLVAAAVLEASISHFSAAAFVIPDYYAVASVSFSRKGLVGSGVVGPIRFRSRASSAPALASSAIDASENAHGDLTEESSGLTDESTKKTPSSSDNKNVTENGENLKIQNSLLRVAASTDRGQNARRIQKDQVQHWIKALESKYPETSVANSSDNSPAVGMDDVLPSSLAGTWELVYSNTQLFRSSPFFLAGRATCKSPTEAEQFDWFCDMHRAALAISTIGTVRQILTKGGKIINEFEVKVGAVPFLSDFFPMLKYSGGLPFAINGAIVSTADLAPSSKEDGGDDSGSYSIHMDEVTIRGSNVPLLRSLLDSQNTKLRTRDLSRLLEENVSGYETPRPMLRMTYVDGSMRIARDQDDNVFIYCRVSESDGHTDYSSVLPDLGVASLLESFNDSVAKIYL